MAMVLQCHFIWFLMNLRIRQEVLCSNVAIILIVCAIQPPFRTNKPCVHLETDSRENVCSMHHDEMSRES